MLINWVGYLVFNTFNNQNYTNQILIFMKNIYLLFIFTLTFHFSNAQIINFTDASLEVALLNLTPPNSDVVVDANGDGLITVLEAQAVTAMNVSNKNISALEGLEHFSNLERFFCDYNFVTDLAPLQSLTSLYAISFIENQLINVDIIQSLYNLSYFECQDNGGIDSIDVSQFYFLEYLDCSNTTISEINTTNNPYLTHLNVNATPIEYMFIKNGNEQLTSGGNLYFEATPNLNYICIDDFAVDSVATQWANYTGSPSDAYLDRINSYCSFTPGGTSYIINGQNTYDSNANGCDVSDESLPFLSFTIHDGTNSGNLISNSTGDYSIAVPQGVYTITPQIGAYFTATPANIIVDFPTTTSPSIQDFCITSNGVYNDLEIIILPLTLARPGFDASYSITYKNKGTTTLSGDVNLAFNDDLIDYVSSTPLVDTANTGELIWNYSNLKPFETRELLLTVNANTPTDPTFPLNNGDVLDFIATINPVSGDETPEDNVFDLHQTVVNSYDPNDKTCLEGKTILPSEVGEYVTYMIRFENNGTASAVNIVVKDVIDVSKYDMSTLRVIKGSHSFVTEVRDNNIVEFIFENINLPFDDANNDGYVSFKVKTLPTLVENDTFENKAEIYFDYNPAIVTNLAQTTVKSLLGISDYQIDNSITYYPNPAKDVLHINSENSLKGISIYDINGRTLLNTELIGSQVQNDFDVSKFDNGVYFIKIVSEKGQFIDKLVIE